jgi:hypothetical protein
MNREDREQFAERWLDEALARYSDAEPRTGLEGRILANLAAEAERRRARYRWLWIPAACAAVIASAVGIATLRHVRPASVPAPIVAHAPAVPMHTQATVNTAQAQTVARPVRVTATAAQPVRVRRSNAAIAKDVEPRKPQFPTPMPPTEQERLLIAYLSATPTHELLAVATDQQKWRERVQKNADAAVQNAAPAPEINHLQSSPLEGGNTEASAPDAR